VFLIIQLGYSHALVISQIILHTRTSPAACFVDAAGDVRNKAQSSRLNNCWLFGQCSLTRAQIEEKGALVDRRLYLLTHVSAWIRVYT